MSPFDMKEYKHYTNSLLSSESMPDARFNISRSVTRRTPGRIPAGRAAAQREESFFLVLKRRAGERERYFFHFLEKNKPKGYSGVTLL